MSDAVSGLLGGIMGASNAVNELSAERRKEMAVALRQQAMAEIERKYQERGFKHAEGLQGENIKARKAEGEADITSREKIASGHDASAKTIAEIRNEMDKEQVAAVKGSTEAKRMGDRNKAFSESAKLFSSMPLDDAISMSNALMSEYGWRFNKYKISDGSSGIPIVGWGKKDPEWGVEVITDDQISKGGLASPQTVSNIQTGLKGELASLLEESKKGGISKPPGGQQITAAEFNGTDSAKDVIEPKPEPKGIMSTAIAGAVPKQKQALGDPVDWEVREQSGQYFLMTKDGPVQMTPEQIAQWKAATGKK